jgi:hypothetical protein
MTQKLPKRLAGIVACFKAVLFITLLQATPSQAQTALEMRSYCQPVASAEVRPSDQAIAVPTTLLAGCATEDLQAFKRSCHQSALTDQAFARRRERH